MSQTVMPFRVADRYNAAVDGDPMKPPVNPDLRL
jgi:hypothetical protein